MAKVQELLQEFHYIASSPREQANRYLAKNKKLIACVPIYTPEEIIHSIGLLPIGAWGGDMEIKEAKAYFPAFICSIMQSILELGMTGAYEGVSAIVIPTLCDSLKCLGQNWKYAVPNIPFIPMTYPQNRNNSVGKEFTKASYLRLIEDLESITGETFSEDNLKISIEIYNEHNRVMRHFTDCAGEYSVIKAADRNAIFKSAYFMEKSEHTKLVKELLEELRKVGTSMKAGTSEITDSRKKSIRVVTTGILADAKELLAIFDDHNIRIVSDDIAHESRQYRVDCPTAASALDSLADKFANMNHCSILYDADKSRVGYITNLVQEKQADGVVVVLTKFCDPEEFDYVIIKNACEDKEIPLLLIEVDRQMVNYEQVRTAVQTFSEMIG